MTRARAGWVLAGAMLATACASSPRPDPAKVDSVAAAPANRPDERDARPGDSRPGGATSRTTDPRVDRPAAVARPGASSARRSSDAPSEDRPGEAPGVIGGVGADPSGAREAGAGTGPAPELVKGTLARGDSAIQWSATLESGRIARIVETIRMGDYGEARATYDMAPDGEIEYAGRESVSASDPAGANDRQLIETRMRFSPKREVLRSEKLVNGAEAQVDASEPAGVLAHLDMLVTTVREARPGAR